MMKTQRDIVRIFAKNLTDKVVKKCIRSLQKLDITLSGDERLKTTWDEICVQLQREYSFYWDDYEDAALNIIKGEVDNLQYYEQLAIWFQTDQALDFDVEEDDEPDFNQIDVYNYIKKELFWRAGNWSNKGIRDYLND